MVEHFPMELRRRITVTLLLLTTLLSGICLPAIAQNSEAIPLKEAFSQIEKREKVKFFYREVWVRDVRVDKNLVSLTLAEFLSKALVNTPLAYTIYEQHYIILIPKEIGEALPKKSDTNLLDESTFVADGQSYTFSGHVVDGNSGEKLIGATLYLEELKTGTVSNSNGFFSLTLASGIYNVTVSAIGKKPLYQKIFLNKHTTAQFDLFETTTQLNDVVVTAEATDRNVSSLEMSTAKLDVRTIKSLPAFMGEADVIKSILLLPGVSTVGDGASGFNVRGGNVDQNLILLDGAPIFNSSHLFGFFSTFNTDLVKEVSLMKGGVPAQYGGRLSSVLDVRMKEGSLKDFSVKGGIGIISSRLSVEGPIIKDKTSFIAGGRYAYPNWILHKTPDINIRQSSGYFYDVNLGVNHKFDEKNDVHFSTYQSADGFKLGGDTLYDWQTNNFSLRWNTLIAKKIYATISGVKTQYNYGTEGLNENDKFRTNFGIGTTEAKVDASYFPSPKHKIDAGYSFVRYSINPGKLDPLGNPAVNVKQLEEEQANESGIYLSDEFKLNHRITLQAGIRQSFYSYLGPKEVYVYEEGVPKSLSSIIDTITYTKNKKIKEYRGFEPRVSAKFSVNEFSSVKASYNKTYQYLHLISNTTAVSPLDIWKASSYYIKPQSADQYAVGYFRNFKNNTIEASVEVYYKLINNMVEYKDGADLFLNQALESELLPARGRAYGAEFLLRKNVGKLTGWIAYTYSRSLRLVKGNSVPETINKGKYYPANFDKPNDLTIVTNYKFSRRLSISTNFTYSTGRPITYPTSVYVVDGYAVTEFSERNQARIPDYHRLDISINLEESLRRNKPWKGSWTFAIVNAYARKNPYSVFFKPEYSGNQPQAYKLSVLGTIFPSITYNFRFE